MEKINFLTFGNEKYYKALERLKNEAYSFNIFDKILIYNNLSIFSDFWNKHSNFIENNKRGYGYWLWKPYLVLKTLETMNNNDILVYADAGCSLNINGINRLNEYFDIVRNSNYGILSFELEHVEKKWCKMDLFEYIDVMNNDNILNSNQLVGGIFILKKCEHTIKLVEMWNDIMSNNYNLIDDSKSKLKNDDSFIEHRHDQSVFSILRKKYGSYIIKDETWLPILEEVDNSKLNYPILARRLIN